MVPPRIRGTDVVSGAGSIGSPTLTSTWKLTRALASVAGSEILTPVWPALSSRIVSALARSVAMARPSSISRGGDLDDRLGDGLDGVVELEAGEVDIAGRSPLVEGGEQHPALEDEAVAVA